MSFGYSLNKYKNAVILESATAQGLLKMIQEIKCPVEIINVYKDDLKHVAWIVTEKKLIKKIKQE